MPEHYDILITNATIVDGTGRPRYRGSVGVKGDKIAAVGDVKGTAARTIDGAGFILGPGFVDPHSHGDLNILQYPLCENYLMQGVTTFFGGNCGHSRAPLTDKRYADRWMYYFAAPNLEGVDPNWRTMGEFLQRVEDIRPGVNYAPLVGHGALRLAVLGEDFMRASTSAEVEEIQAHVQEAMESGAFGMSAGLDYEGEYADPETELVKLCEVVRKYDGVYTPHTRHHDYRWPVPDPKDFGYGRAHFAPEDCWVGRYHGLIEAVELARNSGVRLMIGHATPLYAVLQPHPASVEEAIARATLDILIDKPRQEGLDVTMNVFACPFTAGSRSSIVASLYSPLMNPPGWLKSLSREQLVEKLQTKAFRQKMKDLAFSGTYKFGMLPPRMDPYWMDCLRVGTCKIKEYEGKTIGKLARARSPRWTLDAVYNKSFDVLFDIVAADPDATWDAILDKREDPAALAIFLNHPAVMPLFDGTSLPAKLSPGLSVPPTYFGLYPYYIDTFVKQKGAFSLEHAIRQATAVPCESYRLRDRGVIREGAYADLILFDLDRLHMTGTYAEPNLPTDGMEYVMVNGTLVMDKGKHTGARPGRVLRRG